MHTQCPRPHLILCTVSLLIQSTHFTDTNSKLFYLAVFEEQKEVNSESAGQRWNEMVS